MSRLASRFGPPHPCGPDVVFCKMRGAASVIANHCMIQEGAAVDLAQDDAQRAFRDELRAFLDAALGTEVSDDFEGQRAWQRLLYASRWAARVSPARNGGAGASTCW